MVLCSEEAGGETKRLMESHAFLFLFLFGRSYNLKEHGLDRPKIKRKREKDIVKVWLSTAIFFHNLFRGSFISRVISLLLNPGL